MLPLKHWLIAATDVSPEALHMLCGIMIYLVLAAIDRRLASGRALLLTAGVVFGAETWEWAGKLSRDVPMDWAGLFADLRDGLIWPVLLWLGGRRMALRA